MVSGTLALKNGYYYAVLSYQDAAGKRHQKWNGQKHDWSVFPQKGVNLERAGGSAHPTVLYGEAENRHPEFRYPLSCGDLSGLEVCDENRHGTAECCHEGGQAEEELVSADIP